MPFAYVIQRFLFLSFLWLAAMPARATDPPGAAVNTDSMLHWRADRRLTWADFRGTPGPGEQLHALTSADLNVEISCANDVLTVVVEAFFRPLESWTKSTDSAPLLRHEQFHFDLTEVHARRLRQEITKRHMTCAQAQRHLQEVIDAGFAAWKAEQDRYDAETRHGLDEKAQARWEQRIADQLND
jgi:hypothetical protein